MEIETLAKDQLWEKYQEELQIIHLLHQITQEQKNLKKIVEQIEEGIKKTKGKYSVVVDRTEAIKQAIKMATKRDIIVLAGKGHEPYQEICGKKHPFDERIIVRELIEELESEKNKK